MIAVSRRVREHIYVCMYKTGLYLNGITHIGYCLSLRANGADGVPRELPLICTCTPTLRLQRQRWLPAVAADVAYTHESESTNGYRSIEDSNNRVYSEGLIDR